MMFADPKLYENSSIAGQDFAKKRGVVEDISTSSVFAGKQLSLALVLVVV